MIHILVTGSNGQLGKCLKQIDHLYKEFKFIYTDAEQLDVCNISKLETFFKSTPIDYCINCAAYTAVDNAETETEKAYHINGLGPKNLAIICKSYNVILIHISTDFVFEGDSYVPYTEHDNANPLSVYGASKLQGEQEIIHNTNLYFIIRTSWLYSEYGNNFVKTMLRITHNKQELSVVNDQVGTPTYAIDLAHVLLRFIITKSISYGTYHYSNKGVVSWFDFAKSIFKHTNLNINIKAIPSSTYHQEATRPKYSALNTTKIENELCTEIPFWEDSLKKCLKRIVYENI